MRFFLVLVVFISGCASFTTIDQQRQNVSSAFIGCAPESIQISENKQYTWVSTCKARVFYCTVAPNASCKEAI